MQWMCMDQPSAVLLTACGKNSTNVRIEKNHKYSTTVFVIHFVASIFIHLLIWFK